MKNKRKGQVKMLESVAVLAIFFIIIVIGLVIYGRFTELSIKEESRVEFSAQAVKAAQTLMFLPEFQCAVFGTIPFNCFDIYKLKAASDTSDIDDDIIHEHYSNLFGSVTIAYNQTFPPADSGMGFSGTIFDNPPENASAAINTFIPVAFHNPITQKYGLGIITITSYRRGIS